MNGAFGMIGRPSGMQNVTRCANERAGVAIRAGKR